jgi:hypothetical protein
MMFELSKFQTPFSANLTLSSDRPNLPDNKSAKKRVDEEEKKRNKLKMGKLLFLCK